VPLELPEEPLEPSAVQQQAALRELPLAQQPEEQLVQLAEQPREEQLVHLLGQLEVPPEELRREQSQAFRD
jgi:hypothetical protein